MADKVDKENRRDSLALVHPDVAYEVIEFLSEISQGVGELNAAIGIGWSPHQLAQYKAKPGFNELIAGARTLLIEDVEEMVYKAAKRGNMTAAQLVLYSQAADKGWRPPTQRVSVNQQTSVKVEVLEATRMSVVQLLAERGVAALQPPADPVIDVESEEIAS